MNKTHLKDVNLDEITLLRKELHQYPEVSGNERETSIRVIHFLKSCYPDQLLTEIGKYGIVATWDSGKPGKEVLFRAELDALPIQEINEFDYASTNEGVSHKCGHDGHTSILCGLAQFLNSNKPQSGKVHLLFQPAEENGEGAKAMLEDSRFESIKPDYVFALHNLPGYPKHKIVYKKDTFTAAVTSIIIQLKGKTSHAAEPEHGINPSLAIAEILQETLAQANNHAEKEDMKVITPVYIEMGELSYGISAGEGSVHLTIRCWNDEKLFALQSEIERIAQQISLKHQLEISFDHTQTFHANQNEASAVTLLEKACLLQQIDVEERAYPFKWGEDFGLFTSAFKGCMFGLGSGEDCPALHNPDYDYPDEISETGIRAFLGILKELKVLN